MLNVMKIVLDPLAQIGITTPAVYLRPAGDTRRDDMFFHVIRDLIFELFHEDRTFRISKASS